MANVKIEIVGLSEIGLITQLYNQIFIPGVDEAYFRDRLRNRYNVLIMVAELERNAVGFSVGYELRPTTYYSWLYGVLPDARRLGVASQLLAAEHAWAREHDYEVARYECPTTIRPMLHLALRTGYEIVGIRFDTHIGGNLVIFEKHLQEDEEPEP